MTEDQKLSIADKARRAAEWLRANGVNVRKRRPSTIPEGDNKTHSLGWIVGESIRGVRVTLLEMILFAEDRGWQDTELVIPTEEEAPDLCARAMAQFADEIDPNPIQLEDGDHVADAGNMVDGVEWQTKTIDFTMIGNLCVAVRNEPDGSHSWTVWDNEDWDSKPLAEGTAPTREEARRQAVEAARGMG